ncbi:glycoside hydrolase family 24 protein [Comamonas suwonensis]|uniref:glycoside hydrolase family 24 protein n=1 Tax=Comamonas suwonensis TaxID=2606214 RepID=UPI001F44AE59|nr:glycoside hydrolase family 104 protein [Comamonas suwonensis]
MRNAYLIAAAGLLAAGAWVMYRRQQEAVDAEEGGSDWESDTWTDVESASNTVTQGAAEVIDSLTGGSMKLSNMSRVTAADLNHPNVRALLRVIRRGEGTVDEAGYRRIFGGQLFEGFADHPRIAVTKTMRNGKRITSTAAGAYQFLSSTWDETARIMGLRGFSPANQDLGAVGRIAARNALEDIKAGRFEVAVKKIAWEWASMPGSPYGQPVISMDTARAVYVEAGGSSY